MRQSDGTDRTIKAQLNRIVLIPSVTFLVLFGVLSAGALSEAVALRLAANDSRSGLHAYYAVAELQKERRIAVEHLGAGSKESLGELRSQMSVTDSAIREVEDREEGLRGRGRDDGAATATARDFLTALDERAQIRENVVEGHATAGKTISRYRDIIDHGIRAYSTLGRLLGSSTAATASADAVDLMQAQEHLSLADAIISGADAADTMTLGDQQRFGAILVDARQRIESVGPALHGDTASAHADLVDSSHWEGLHQLAKGITRHDLGDGTDEAGEPPPALGQWRSAADTTNSDLLALADSQAHDVLAEADSASGDMLTLALGGGILVIFATTVAYGVASKSAARLTYRLAQLRAETLELSRNELPRLVRRLENGEKVDPDAELRPLDHGTDEVGQVADAFNIAQRTAVAAAVKQAEVRDGANRVFLGIAHRNQSLVQRQLRVLDRVEREADDPDLLEDLFQLDHLATRGRRNAENLIILGGQQPGRRWRTPIPLVDILRGAISETEEYARVKPRVVPDVSLPGAVVADVLHLLAELVENATAYSPPHTTVHIHGEIVAKGLVVEVEDRGLGMSEPDLAEANRRLSEAPEFDVMALNQDDRLGLFVVARLATKHGIHVELRPSPYGGTRGVVLIPEMLVSRGTVPTTTRPQPHLGPRDVDTGQRPAARQRANGAPAICSDPGAVNHQRDGAAAPANGTTVPVGNAAPSGLPKRTPRSSLAPDSGAVEPVSPEPEQNGDRPPLPRRQRQANLAPQLRNSTGQQRTGDTAGDAERNPDAVRQMFSAFQTGTQRGRDNDDGPNGGVGARSGDARPDSEPAGVMWAGPTGGGHERGAASDAHGGLRAEGADSHDANGPGPLPGAPVYTAGARDGYAGHPAGDRKGDNE